MNSVPPDIVMESDNHRSSIENGDSADSPHLVAIVPQSAPKTHPFDGYVYRPFGQRPEDDQTRLPWSVPALELTKATPPSSVHGDTSSASSIHEDPIATGSRESFVTQSPRPEDVSSDDVRVSEDVTKKARFSEENLKSETGAMPKEIPNKKRRQSLSGEKQADEPRKSNVTCLHVMQSKWLQHPDDNSREIVTLTSEVTGLESENMDAPFRWMQRETSPTTFEAFEKVIDITPSLYSHERAVASKCIKEAKMSRRSFARGKYFAPFVYGVSDIVGSPVERRPVRARFLSVPIFALFADSINGGEDIFSTAGWGLRPSDHHPIRSLLQYSNILALDSKRDDRQVITRVIDDLQETKKFIHVPELWALVVNMYTVITCAPFSFKALHGENINLSPYSTKDQGMVVKYTDLRGLLHDVRFRTWFDLLDKISRIEMNDEIKSLLNDPTSEYKIINLRFRSIDSARWHEWVKLTGSRQINLRLVCIVKDHPLTLEFVERKRKAYLYASWILLGLMALLASLKTKARRLRQDDADQGRIDRINRQIQRTSEMVDRMKRSRNFNRFLLYAARCHILNPRRQREARKADTIRSAQAKNTTVNVTENKPKAQDMLRRKSMTFETNSLSSSQPCATGIPAINIGVPPESQSDSPGNHPLTSPMTNNALRSPGYRLPRENDLEAGNLPQEPSSNYPIDLDFGSTFSAGAVRADFDQDTVTLPRYSSIWPQDPSYSQSPPGYGSTLPAGSQIVPSIVDPYFQSSVDPQMFSYSHSASTSQVLPNIHQKQSMSNKQFPTAAVLRRSATEVLPVSPQRLPLTSEDDVAGNKTVETSSSVSTRNTGHEEPLTVGNKNDISKRAGQNQKGGRHEAAPPLTISERASKRTSEIRGLLPFFEWHTPSHDAASTISAKSDQDVQRSELEEKTVMSAAQQEQPEHTDRSEAADTLAILSDIDSFITAGKYFGANRFHKDYDKISTRKENDVMTLLQEEQDSSNKPDQQKDLGQVKARDFLKTKIDLFLRVHVIVNCFVNQDRQESKLIGKIWGIVYAICELTDTPKGPPGLLWSKHEIEYVQAAEQELKKYEEKCKQLLMGVRPEDGEGETAQRHQPLQSLFGLFRDIVLFLLCSLLAVTEADVDSNTVEAARDRVTNGLRESKGAFLRLAADAATDLDQIGYESIGTAETLLGLILENAFSLSCDGQVCASKESTPIFDILDVYSRYTSECITHAKQDASARVYEDIRLLREEIDTISLILKHQRSLFHRILATRESPFQKLDKRLNYRIQSQLNERITHFAMLSNYAVQAEFWTRNSIEVRSEANNKAIYVFTAVTVIFLPLSFVASILGMNTSDVRNMSQGQGLFWAVAVPFTLMVLLICLCITQYKFKLKRRLWNILFRNRFGRTIKRSSDFVKRRMRIPWQGNDQKQPEDELA